MYRYAPILSLPKSCQLPVKPRVSHERYPFRFTSGHEQHISCCFTNRLQAVSFIAMHSVIWFDIINLTGNPAPFIVVTRDSAPCHSALNYQGFRTQFTIRKRGYFCSDKKHSPAKVDNTGCPTGKILDESKPQFQSAQYKEFV